MEQDTEIVIKMSPVVVKCRKLSWRLSQIVVTFFFPSPSRRPLLVFADSWALRPFNRRTEWFHWVHTNKGGTTTGGSACVCAKRKGLFFWCIFERLWSFLCVSVRLFLPKWLAKNRKYEQNSEKMCKKRFYAILPLVGSGVLHKFDADFFPCFFFWLSSSTQSPPGPRTQGEHVSVHCGIFGPKGMLVFAKIKISEESEPLASAFSSTPFGVSPTQEKPQQHPRQNSARTAEVVTNGVANSTLRLWPCWPHRTPQTPKQLKSQKGDSKVTFGGHPNVTPKVTRKLLFGYFWVSFG